MITWSKRNNNREYSAEFAGYKIVINRIGYAVWQLHLKQDELTLIQYNFESLKSAKEYVMSYLKMAGVSI